MIGIISYSGNGNLGDNLLLDQVIADFKEINPMCEFAACSPCSDAIVNRYGLKRVTSRDELDGSVIFGGVVGDAQRNILKNFFETFRYMEDQGKPAIFYGIGVNPITTALSADIIYDVIQNATLVTVRDQMSYRRLRQIGVTRDIIIAPDIVLQRQMNLHTTIQPEGILFIMADFFGYDNTRHEDFIHTLAATVDYFAKKKTKVSVMSFHDSRDQKCIQAIQFNSVYAHRVNWLTVKEHDYQRMFNIFEEHTCIVPMRLHAMISAILVGRPCVPIAYHTKMDELAEMALIDFYSIPFGDGTSSDHTRMPLDQEFVAEKIERVMSIEPSKACKGYAQVKADATQHLSALKAALAGKI